MTLDAYLTGRHLTLKAFAARLGEVLDSDRIAPSTIWKWRRGKAMPRPHIVLAIERVTENQVTARDVVVACVANETPAA
jgi:transcriptional regulator with XRE-family HTH domain